MLVQEESRPKRQKLHLIEPPPVTALCEGWRSIDALVDLPLSVLLGLLRLCQPPDVCRLACVSIAWRKRLRQVEVDRVVWMAFAEILVSPSILLGNSAVHPPIGETWQQLVKAVWTFDVTGTWEVQGHTLSGTHYSYTWELRQMQDLETPQHHPLGFTVKIVHGAQADMEEDSRMSFDIEAALDGTSLLIHQKCQDRRDKGSLWVNICHAVVLQDTMLGTWVQQDAKQDLISGSPYRGRFEAKRTSRFFV
mmetsp:Transcript_29787/g.67508  ORF Transcript_29787/g.67508 Transcript_29787/m.67508 type:complete len:250 (-) Transcript_29787:30-779(-)